MEHNPKFYLLTLLTVAGLGFVGDLDSLYGKWKEISAPKLEPSILQRHPASVENQRQLLIEFESQACAADLCGDSTHGQDANFIVETCEKTFRDLSKISVPSALPLPVFQNLSIYHESRKNNSLYMIDNWSRLIDKTTRRSTFLKKWTINTCDYDSIPQKIFRLYGLDKATNKRFVRCKDIQALTSERNPASIQ